ncbi:MAG: HNH endonuclease [Clostridia bacterium]|nr:HNH endonuclease [Clostridia bacterium]
MVCGFDFEKTYGDLGKDFIEVHHTKPLFSLEEEVKINPRTDLVCVCSNCHRMIHRKRDSIISIDELKKIINKQ